MLSTFLLKSLVLCSLLVSGCDANEPEEIIEFSPREATCSIPIENITEGGVGKDVVPALSDIPFVDVSEISYLSEFDRVIGFMVEDKAYAIPHNILWYHEIINFEIDDLALAMTYCPLTGSSMAFKRNVIEGGEFGVSGLLWNNNLIMFDRTSSESLWPQMNRRADCGPRLGASLDMHPVIEMTWAGWKALNPDSKVLSNQTGFNIGYTSANYPYGNYENPDNDGLLFDMEIDRRRPPKARLLGIPDNRLGGTAFLFSELDNGALYNVVHSLEDIGPVVVFWDNTFHSAMAYSPRIGNERINFEVRDEQIRDLETGSVWQVDGLAIEGPLAGTRLAPIDRAFVSFWFAWAAFHVETEIWEAR
ncbi:MAG: DUF3179 domain-containing protein [Rhodothermales bacterium]